MKTTLKFVAIAVITTTGFLYAHGSYHQDDMARVPEAIRHKTLEEVIENSIIFDKDYISNRRQAGYAVVSVNEDLKALSSETNIPFENLQFICEVVIGSGGMRYSTTLNEIVSLTKSFALAIQAAEKGPAGERNAVFEIPRLLAGTESPGSRLLKSWGLSRAEWREMLRAGRAHRDLYLRLMVLTAK